MFLNQVFEFDVHVTVHLVNPQVTNVIYIYIYIYIYMEHLFLMFLDHTQRRTTVGRTPLDERSSRRRDLYLTTHDTHNRQISMPPVGFEPTISAGISRLRVKHAAQSPFFSSKCRLFHNAIFFGSCIIHILHTECAKI